MAKVSTTAGTADIRFIDVHSLISVRVVSRAGAVAVLALSLANCANDQVSYSNQQKREFGAFSHSKYGAASPKVYADNGAPLPKGGGRDHLGPSYRVAGKSYTPHDRPLGTAQVGHASWYGAAFHGRKTANGEVYDRRAFSAAHPTMPLPSYARVTNLKNGSSVIVRVNDRGPYHGGRIMDVSERVAEALQFKSSGTGRIKVDYLGRAGLGGSDDIRLAQSLRTDGTPATSDAIPASYPGKQGAQAIQVAMGGPEPVVVKPPSQQKSSSFFTSLFANEQQGEQAASDAPATKQTETAGLTRVSTPLPPMRPLGLTRLPGQQPAPSAKPERSASLTLPTGADLRQ